jgi:hypothetical protein
MDGTLREFVHPPDGSLPVERPVGSAPLDPPPADPPVLGGPVPEAGVNRLGQLVGRNVEPRDLARPLALPFLRASCDGSGSCCGLYHHIPATREDQARITGLLGATWDRPVPLEEVFVPAFDAHPAGPLNVLEIDGSCAFQDPDGLCAVHKAGGIEAKPQACISYPAHLVVCGERWVASLRPECACMLRTAVEGPRLSDDPGGWARLRSMMAAVWTVPMLVTVLGDVVVTRTDYRTWTERQVAALSNTLDPVSTLCVARAELDVVAEQTPSPTPCSTPRGSGASRPGSPARPRSRATPTRRPRRCASRRSGGPSASTPCSLVRCRPAARARAGPRTGAAGRP